MNAFLAAMLRLRAFAPLRYRDFRLVTYAQVCGNLGTWMDEVSRGWLIYELTDSAVQLGLVRGIQVIPFLLLSPLAGSVADRYSRRTQLIITQAANAVIFAAIAVLVFTATVQAWHVYVAAFIAGTVTVFQQPARAAMVGDTVPSELLTNAIGLGAVGYNVARVAGPALAGVLIAIAGTGSAFAVQALMLLLAAAWIAQLAPVERRKTAHKESFGESIVEGWRFSWRSEPVRAGLLCTVLVAVLIAPFTTLLPVYARDLLGVGATGQGLMLTAMGFGALVSAAMITAAGHRLPRGMVMLSFSTLYGLVLLPFAASNSFALSLALMFVTGLCHVNGNALVQTIIQSYSPPEFRGRVLAMFAMAQVLTTAGAVLVGALAVPLGPRWAVAAMGMAGTLSIIALAVAIPRARRIR